MNASRRPMLLAALLALAPSLMSQKVEPASRKSPQKQKSKEAAERRALAVSIRRGLKWLRDHQEPDGRWRALGFPELCPEGDHCKGRGNATNDIGVTGLAILAIAGSARSGPYESVAKAGVAWLQSQMSGPGLIGKQAGLTFMYNHAIATFALLEAQRLLRFEEPVSAKRAIDYILRARNPYKVWRYHPHSGENDTSVTGWMVLALSAAKRAGVEIDTDALKYAAAWFEEVTDFATGRCGYTSKEPGSSRPEGAVAKFPPEETEALTALGLLCRLRLGQGSKTHPIIDTAAQTILAKPPVWEPEKGKVDYYYWFYGSSALRILGGKQRDQWNQALVPALRRSQATEGHAAGSWNPVGPWGHDGGRVYSTAMALLCLETSAGLYEMK